MRPPVVVTVLVDNLAAPGLACEHGLALWIETAGLRILFDTGQSDAFDSNARVRGIATTMADALVLSHGHYDHTGGVAHALARAPGMQIYAHPAVTRPRCSIRDGVAKDLQMPADARRALAQHPPARLHWVRQPSMLAPTVGLTGPIPRTTAFEDVGGPFFLDAAGAQPDMIEDDLALWIATPAGLVVCCGCCHAGLINTLQYICRVAGATRIAGIIGGLHLLHADAARMAATSAALRAYAPRQIIACHCTGAQALQALHTAFPEQVTTARTGMCYAFTHRGPASMAAIEISA